MWEGACTFVKLSELWAEYEHCTRLVRVALKLKNMYDSRFIFIAQYEIIVCKQKKVLSIP